ncbi:MAG TPA: alpha/beta hydrolase [Acidimicrobiales bacterium]|nr:alpha/beta hydrolase [Acidimicrobiales bacterium]
MSTPPKTSARRSAAPGATKAAKSNAAKATQAVKARATKAARTSRAALPTKVRTKAKAVPTAKAASAASGANTRRSLAVSPASVDGASREAAGPWVGVGRWPGRGFGRERGIYNRQLQRANEHWPIRLQLLSWLFRRPETLLSLLGKPAPIRADSRVLNRSVQAVLEVMTRMAGVLGRTDTEEEGLGDLVLRRKQMQGVARFMPIRTDVHVVDRSIPSARGSQSSPDLPVRIYRRFGAGIGAGVGRGSLPPAIVFYHGGGWVEGDLVSHDPSCRLLASVSGCVVIAVDYRLAPEHPFPAAVEDSLAAYAWVHEHAEELGIAEGRVGVMGDSAGGNLAAVVALLTRDGAAVPTSIVPVPPGIPAPVAQGLVYPGLTTRFDSESYRLFATGFFLTAQSMRTVRSAYLPSQGDWELEAASPLLADDLDGVAPALVVTAGFDPLRDDGDAYAAKLKRAGIEVEHRCYDDQVHGFFGMGFLDDSLALSVEVCDAMGRMMHRDGPSRGGG